MDGRFDFNMPPKFLWGHKKPFSNWVICVTRTSDKIPALGQKNTRNAYVAVNNTLLSTPMGVDYVFVVLLIYVHGKHLRSCRDGQLT